MTIAIDEILLMCFHSQIDIIEFRMVLYLPVIELPVYGF